MKIWQIVISGLLGLALAGCRSDPEIALLQRDNFKKEKEIDRLRNRVEDLEEALNAAAPTQAGIIRGVPPVVRPPEARTFDGGRSGPAANGPVPLFTPPDRPNSEPEVPGVVIPHIDRGQEVTPGEVPDRMKVPGMTAPPSAPASGGSSQWSPADGHPAVIAPPADNGPVAQITLHPALTGGIGSGGHSGDEGLLVVVEPRDFGGNIVNAPGNISVALLDPAQTGDQARLARWDFTVEETQGMIRTGSQPGIHLRLPWISTPAHDRLKVFVRYTTRDGRKLQTERLIAVALDGPRPARQEALSGDDPAQTASRPQRPQWSPVR